MRSKKTKLSEKKRLEIEIKLKVSNWQRARSSILALGFEEKVHRAFEENWILDFPQKSLAQDRCLLRLRQFDGHCVLTFKAPAPASNSCHFKIREELETEVADVTALFRILERLGLIQVFHYQKYRSVFVPGRVRHSEKIVLSLDETPIGNYLEIEGTKGDIIRIASQLSFSERDFIVESYLGLYAQLNPRSSSREMIFPK